MTPLGKEYESAGPRTGDMATCQICGSSDGLEV
ncbi:hypothetical protein Hamer_G003551, partial [Homarus americanus]